jgi:hypothetical protein
VVLFAMGRAAAGWLSFLPLEAAAPKHAALMPCPASLP